MIRAMRNGIMFLGTREHQPHCGVGRVPVPWGLPLTTHLLKSMRPCPQLGVIAMQHFDTESGQTLGLALIKNGSAGLKQTLQAP